MAIENEQTERIIALAVIKKVIITTPKETDQMHIYQNGLFKHERFDSTIRQCIKEIANRTLVQTGKEEKPYHLSIARQTMIIDFIKSFTYCSLEDFDSDEDIINVKNGLYSFKGFEVIIPNPNSEDGSYNTVKDKKLLTEKTSFISHEKYRQEYKKGYYKSFIQIHVNYDPTKENLEIDQIFEDVFGMETVPLIYEMIGYLLLPHTKYSKAFMFYGETGTGKTTALNIITQFVGYENISGIELQMLDYKFELEKTRNKLINIFDDLSSKPIKYVGNFKKLVTNTWLYGRIKFIQEEIGWKNRCKGLFACNVLPEILHYVTDAFYTRWVLIPCFTDMKEKRIKDSIDLSLDEMKKRKKEDAKKREKKYSKAELSGLFNKVIQAITILNERGGFPEKWQDIEFVKNYWNMDINPVAIFIKECCEKEDSKEVEYEQFFKFLNIFRKEKRVREIKKRHMTRSLKKMGILKVDRGSKVDKDKRYIFTGIDFKDEFIMDHLELYKKEEPNILKNLINGDF